MFWVNKRIMKKNILTTIVCILSFITAISQNSQSPYSVTLPYSCGFEDSEDLSQWVLNSGADGKNCQDQWMIDNCDAYEGFKSLYVSADSGQTVSYGAKPNYVIAYRPFEIVDTISTTPRFKINISFFWKGLGVQSYSYARFYFVDARDFENKLNSSSSSSYLPKDFQYSTAEFHSIYSWEFYSYSTYIKTNTKYYMILVWVNANDDKEIKDFSFAIDDLQITNADCGIPTITNVEVVKDSIVVVWDAPHTDFDIEYKRSDQHRWKRISNVHYSYDQEKKYVLPRLAEGVYDIRLRGICSESNLSSAWVSSNSSVIYLPEMHCIDYVNLDDINRVRCLEGTAMYTDNPGFGNHLKPTGRGNGAGPVDYGSKDIRSRHTINWKQNEFDPRTGNGLRTIPEGSLASVRLGNWKNGYGADGIMFDYHVDTAVADIILLTYAVVLEAPGHGIAEDPFFRLQILDKQSGRVVNTDCGSFDFSPGNDDINWHKYKANVWKDWTSIGLNLLQYHGRDLQIFLFTQDCMQGAHFGYAYFTLDCIDAKIETSGCGDSFELELVAPEGFRYEWTSAEDRTNILSRDAVYKVPTTDTATYYCKIDYFDKDNCSFELSTVAKPRSPHAKFSYDWKPTGCKNRVVFHDESTVDIMVNNVPEPTDESCEDFEWIVGGHVSQGREFDYVFPNEGGTFPVVLRASISGGMCFDDDTVWVQVPPIEPTNDTVYQSLCAGEPYIFDDKFFVLDTLYTAQDTTWCGCDSITVLDLNVAAEIEDTYVSDTICSDSAYIYNGEVYNESGRYEIWLKSASLCDSVVILTLNKMVPIGVEVDDSYRYICADEKFLYVDYNVVEGEREPFEYSVLYDSFAKQYGFVDVDKAEVGDEKRFVIEIPDSCRPNTYTATIVVRDSISFCGDKSIPIDFDIYYSSDILQPKFGNLITVLDETENGGYEFVEGEYKWYKNDQLVDTVVNAFYYLSNGVTFNGEDCFYMIPKRKDDGVAIRTCKICPGEGTPIVDVYDSEELIQTTVLERGGIVLLNGVDDAVVNIYSFTGLLISSHSVNANNSYIVVPNEIGFYIAQIKTKDRSYVYKIWVR